MCVCVQGVCQISYAKRIPPGVCACMMWCGWVGVGLGAQGRFREQHHTGEAGNVACVSQNKERGHFQTAELRL